MIEGFRVWGLINLAEFMQFLGAYDEKAVDDNHLRACCKQSNRASNAGVPCLNGVGKRILSSTTKP